MVEDFQIRRRKRRASPMRTRKVGMGFAAAGAGAGGASATPAEFPGIESHEPESKSAWLSGGLAAFVHAAGIAAMLALAWASPDIKEEIIELQLLKEPPAKKTDPAPARRVIAERRSSNFAQSAQTVKPDIVNPRVVARRSAVSAESVQLESVGQVVAPRKVARARVNTSRVSALAAAADVSEAKSIDSAVDTGPSVKRTEVVGPAGPSVGPRAIVAKGDSIGTGPTVILGVGSSVREGIDSNRDVAGSRTGPRLASVNTAIGDGYLDGSGGTGEGGVALGECFERPQVAQYLTQVQSRIYARWALPSGVQPNQSVVLRFKLDPAGSATRVELVSAADRALGESAVEALRSASPFPAMTPEVRCLSRQSINGTFRNPVGG